MKRVSIALIGLFLVSCIVLPGCGGGGGATPAAQVKTYALDSLPAVGTLLPPLDEGRVRVAPPENWRVLSRREGYVAVFCDSATGGPPRITITAEDALPVGIQDVTPDNVAAYAAEQAKLLSEKRLVEPVKPMVLGNNAWARYVVAATFKGSSAIEIQVLTTVVSGRAYTLKLQVYEGTIPKYRDPAYAAAAAIEFVNKSAPGIAPPPSEDPPSEDPPSEDPPSEDPFSEDPPSEDGGESPEQPAAE